MKVLLFLKQHSTRNAPRNVYYEAKQEEETQNSKTYTTILWLLCHQR